jgi:hypothetical protein
MVRATGLVVLALALAACNTSGPNDRTRRPVPRVTLGQAAPLVAVPRSQLEQCEKSALLRSACPRLVPRTEAPYLSHLSRQPPGSGLTLDVYDLERGGEDPRRPGNARPPAFAHLTVLAGEVEQIAGFAQPLTGTPVSLKTGLMRKERKQALFFGRVRWGGRMGSLFLAPPFIYGGQLGNHLCFRWRGQNTDYLISLHAWEPLSDAAATLRAIVAAT